MLQDHRNRVFHDFRNGACRNLVCTGLFFRPQFSEFFLVSFVLPEIMFTFIYSTDDHVKVLFLLSNFFSSCNLTLLLIQYFFYGITYCECA